MVKLLTPGLEREFIQKTQNNVLDKQLCHICLSNEMKKWLNLYPTVNKKISSELKAYVMDVDENTLDADCSNCKKNKAALCPYCFSEGVFNLLKKNKVNVMVIMDYLSTFSFDKNHDEYANNSKQMEVLQ
jgi:hypothetical protein